MDSILKKQTDEEYYHGMAILVMQFFTVWSKYLRFGATTSIGIPYKSDGKTRRYE